MNRVWREVRLRHVFARRDVTNRPDLQLLSVYRDLGVVPRDGREDNYNKPGEDLGTYRVVQPGDVVLNKMKTWQGSIGISDYEGIVSPAYFVARPLTGDDPRFLHHLLRSRPLVAEYGARSKGIRPSQWDLPWDAFQDIRVALPPLDEQRAIADYLDRETARIDALILAKEKMIKLLRERVAAALQEAINASQTSTSPLRRLVSAFVDYRGATPEKSPSGVPLITATNVTGGRIDLSAGEQFVSEETYASWMRRGFPEPGDVLLTTEAPLGEVAAIVDPKVALAQRLILLKPDRARVTPEFLRASLLSSKVQADLLSRASGSTVWGIRADRLRDVLIPTPKLADQRLVTELAQRAEADAERGARAIGRQSALLRERRQALIAAAVSGHVEVSVSA